MSEWVSEWDLSNLWQQLRHSPEGSGGFEVVPPLEHQLHHVWISGADCFLQHWGAMFAGPHIHKHTQTQKERGIQSHPSSRCSYDQFMEDLTCCIPVSIANATCRLKLCRYRGELQNSKDYWTGNFETFVIERWEGYVDIVLVCKYKANKRTLQVAEIASQLTQPQHRMNTAKKNVIKYTSSIKSHLSNSYHFLWWHQLHVSGELSRIPNGPATLLDGEVFVL